MAKLSKRTVDAASPRSSEYFIWDDELPGFGLRVFASGKKSYLVQYRSAGRTRRYRIGAHGPWTPETVRKEARVLLGRIAQGENPSEERQLDYKAITVEDLCGRYLDDAEKGLILGKKRRPKKASTLVADRSRIERHIIPLLGTRRVKDVTSSDVTRFIRDVVSGKTKVDIKTKKRGRAIVRGGAGTASRAAGLLGGIFTYAVEHGVVDKNPVHGVKRAADRVKERRLSEEEYRLLGKILREAECDSRFARAAAMIRFLALTGCRRGEVVNLQWIELDEENSSLRLNDSKEGASTRAVGLPALELLETLRPEKAEGPVFPGTVEGKPFVGFPRDWKKLLEGGALAEITPHVLRHSFASVANDLGFTEATVAALLGHSRRTITSRYIHTVDTALVMAADTISGYIRGLLAGIELKKLSYALDRQSREARLAGLFRLPLETSAVADRVTG